MSGTPLRIPCPICAGTGNHTLGGGRDNAKDVCATCGGAGSVDPGTGASRAASADPVTGEVHTAERVHWRVGRRVPRNVYQGDVPRFMAATSEQAEEMVALLNAGEAVRAAASINKAGSKIIAGLEDALAFARGDESRATLHTFVVGGGKAREVALIAAIRDHRQQQMRAWVTRNWSAAAMAPNERVERLIEEVCELAQFEGVTVDRIAHIAGKVYQKPVADDPNQEVGGIATCLLAYCAARGLSIDACEANELARILALPAEHFRQRHAAKVAAGMADHYDSVEPGHG